MAAQGMNLLALQRGIRKHLVHGADDIGGHIRGDPLPRLAVYHHAYRAQLVACLCETFERVWAWLGDARFHTAARHHIEPHPPPTWPLTPFPHDFPPTFTLLY